MKRRRVSTRFRLYTVVATLVAFTLVTSGCVPAAPPAHADYPGYSSIGDIADAADLVVHVKFMSADEEVLHPALVSEGDPAIHPQAGLDEQELEAAMRDGAVPVTVSTVQILEVLAGSGSAPGDLIRISQLGTREQSSAETTLLSALSPDDTAVLFLRSWGADPYDLLNPEQGMFVISRDGNVRALSSDPRFTVSSLGALRAAAR